MIIKEFTWRALPSGIPLLFVPVIIIFVDDNLTSSIMLSLATGISSIVLGIQDYFHHKVTGEWLLPRLSTPLLFIGAVAMLAQVILFAAGLHGWHSLALQVVVLVMFIHSAVREWKRWVW